MKNDVEAYLECEQKIDQIFGCHNYSEEKKIKLALEFIDYASVWWDQLVALEYEVEMNISQPKEN